MDRYINILIGDYSVLYTSNDKKLLTDEEKELIIYTGDVISNRKSKKDFGITLGTLNLEKMLCSSELSFGECNSTKLEVQLYNLKTDVCGRTISVIVNDNGVDRTLFTGVIESSTTDDTNVFRDIVAYDSLYFLRDLDVASWWNSFWEDKTVSTLGDLSVSLFEHVGLQYETRSLVNDSMAISKYNDFTSIKFGDLLTMLGQANLCFPHVDGMGVLNFTTLNSVEEGLTLTYEKTNSEFADYTTKAITGINIYGSSNELSQSYPLGNSGGNAYPIAGNIFLLSLSSEDLNSRCAVMYENLKDIQYAPCTIKMVVSDLSLYLGQPIETDKGIHYIMSQTFSGSQFVEQEIKCVASGEDLNQNVSTHNDSIIEGRKSSQFIQTIDKISMSVKDIQDKTDGYTEDISELKITAQNIQMNFVSKDEKEYKDLTTNITFDATGIDIKGKNNTTSETSSLHIGSDAVTIKDSDNNEVASMQANEFRTSEWLMTQTKNNTIFNIFRRH